MVWVDAQEFERNGDFYVRVKESWFGSSLGGQKETYQPLGSQENECLPPQVFARQALRKELSLFYKIQNQEWNTVKCFFHKRKKSMLCPSALSGATVLDGNNNAMINKKCMLPALMAVQSSKCIHQAKKVTNAAIYCCDKWYEINSMSSVAIYTKYEDLIWPDRS